MDDFEYDERPCPACGHAPTHWRDCSEIGCDDGVIDVYDDDPTWYDPGETEVCQNCAGTGHEHWCPKCGWDAAGLKLS